MSESPIFKFNDDDPALQRAYNQARSTFRYFWRELAWERRRIIPALEMACVKAPFRDAQMAPDAPEAEQMWCGEVDFDGKVVTAVLTNSPQWVQSVAEGDEVQLSLDQITDWIYVMEGRAYGGFTVQAMRAEMEPNDRAAHDEMWGVDFGDPESVAIVPPEITSLMGEHPMSENSGEKLAEFLAGNPSEVNGKGETGFTMLHSLALAGSLKGVQILLSHGADVHAVTDHGMTPLQLANALQWDEVATLLRANGATA